MLKMSVRLRNWIDSDRGATATEYGILVAFIAFLIIAGATLFGGALRDYFGRLATTVGGWAPGATP
jgi:pilus assembly protein Flp/PilA